MNIVMAILWFLLMITIIMVVHEGGHMLAARLMGVRVTEFCIGLPFGPRLWHTSKRTGIRYGVTLALLGGYTRIAGMVSSHDEIMPDVYGFVCSRGAVHVSEVAEALSLPYDRTLLVLQELASWGSVAVTSPLPGFAAYDEHDERYATVAHDGAGLTILDRGFNHREPCANEAAEPVVLADPVQALAQERSHTYEGVGLLKRLVMLLAGIFCNLLFALLLLTILVMVRGVPVVSETIASVDAQSPAAVCGLEAGDHILSLDGYPAADYTELGTALQQARTGELVELVYERNHERIATTVTLAPGSLLGVTFEPELYHPTIPQACMSAGAYIASSGSYIAQLLIPTRAMEVVESSAGVVGIAVITEQAVTAGFIDALFLLAILSVSLGWLNLLPVMPLDGGRVLLELVQAVIRRPVSGAVQGILNLIGIMLVLLLFVLVLVQDIGRISAGLY